MSFNSKNINKIPDKINEIKSSKNNENIKCNSKIDSSKDEEDCEEVCWY